MPNPLFLTPINDIPPKNNIVLAAGRVDDWHYKGFDVLFHAWKSLYHDNDRKNLRDWWLMIAGAGKQESFEYLMNLLPDGNWVHNEDDNENENWFWRSEKYHIEFLGFQKNIEKLYQDASIFVLSSRYEGFGLVLIEAMSQGCAPIACDYKGRQREIINPNPTQPLREGVNNSSLEICKNGLLCRPDNVEVLADAIKKMIEDDEYRENVRRNAIELSKYYSIKNTIDRWGKLFQNIMNS